MEACPGSAPEDLAAHRHQPGGASRREAACRGRRWRKPDKGRRVAAAPSQISIKMGEARPGAIRRWSCDITQEVGQTRRHGVTAVVYLAPGRRRGPRLPTVTGCRGAGGRRCGHLKL